jgi:hypothetical protein
VLRGPQHERKSSHDFNPPAFVLSFVEGRTPFSAPCESQFAVATVSEDEPKVAVEELCRSSGAELGVWLFVWRIQNLTEQPVKFLAARCPHGQFKSAERVFDPPLQAAAERAATIEMSVRCDEPAGAVIENGFLILLVEWLNDRWRIFVRLRVTINQQGVPETATELITTQRVGFSGVG